MVQAAYAKGVKIAQPLVKWVKSKKKKGEVQPEDAASDAKERGNLSLKDVGRKLTIARSFEAVDPTDLLTPEHPLVLGQSDSRANKSHVLALAERLQKMEKTQELILALLQEQAEG